jgi:lysylphosphatidylglycerol synthetase-like protein (DUF2156 family)
MWLLDNPFTRVAAQIGGAIMLILLAVAALLRHDRKTQRARDAEKDRARADRLRGDVHDAAGRRVRPGDIVYRD